MPEGLGRGTALNITLILRVDLGSTILMLEVAVPRQLVDATGWYLQDASRLENRRQASRCAAHRSHPDLGLAGASSIDVKLTRTTNRKHVVEVGSNMRQLARFVELANEPGYDILIVL
jgi:hypothetical protein